MSEPKRYSRRDIYDVTYQAAGDECLPEPSEKGEFVRWEDYAKLKAEFEAFMITPTSRLLRSERKEVARLKAEREWQPIETAPMDGTDILCFCVEPEFEGEEDPWTEFRVCFYGMLNEGESCWMSNFGYEQRPTHWMLLPKPPTP
jgi:hypothetical protein